MEEKTAIQKAQEDIKNKVYGEIRKIYPEYQKIVNSYHEVLNADIYSYDHKLKKREEALEEIEELKNKYTSKGLEELSEVLSKYNPEPEPVELSEIEKLTKVMIYKDTLEELPKEKLQQLYNNYKHDEDMKALFDNVSRKNNNIKYWIEQSENPVKNQFDNLIEKERKMINSIGNSLKDRMILVDETGEFKGMRDIGEDIDLGTPIKLEI